MRVFMSAMLQDLKKGGCDISYNADILVYARFKFIRSSAIIMGLKGI